MNDWQSIFSSPEASQYSGFSYVLEDDFSRGVTKLSWDQKETTVFFLMCFLDAEVDILFVDIVPLRANCLLPFSSSDFPGALFTCLFPNPEP